MSNTTYQRPQLTREQLPKYAPYIAIGAALVLGGALSAITGSNPFLWGLYSAIFFVIIYTAWSLKVEGARKAKDRMMTCFIYAAFILAVLPLLSLIITVIINGVPGISWHFLTNSMNGVTGADDMRSVNEDSPVIGGIYHAMLGTLLITFWAALLAIPIGILTAIYLVEYGQGKRLGKAITFFVDVMTGIPSIVAGLFAASLFAILFGPGTKTGFVGALALAVLMIPVVVRTTEEMLKIVPHDLREASYALGVRKWRTIIKVVLPTAISGIASGIVFAIARVIGETAPLLVTAGFAEKINNNVFSGWMSTLPTFIYYQFMNPSASAAPEPSYQRAWAAVLVLVVMVLVLNLLARLTAKIFAPKSW